MTYLEPVALFLSLWRYVHGAGAEIPFIGTKANYLHTNTDSSHDIIARSEIYLSVVKPEQAHGEAFNTADNMRPVSWVERWPVMTGYFGLKGGPPVEPAESKVPETNGFRCMLTELPQRHFQHKSGGKNTRTITNACA